jgi:hypothetical protein
MDQQPMQPGEDQRCDPAPEEACSIVAFPPTGADHGRSCSPTIHQRPGMGASKMSE